MVNIMYFKQKLLCICKFAIVYRIKVLFGRPEVYRRMLLLHKVFKQTFPFLYQVHVYEDLFLISKQIWTQIWQLKCFNVIHNNGYFPFVISG